MTSEKAQKSYIVTGFSHLIEWGNEWLTLAHWLFKKDDPGIFRKLEILMTLMTLFCVAVLFYAHRLSPAATVVISVIFIQRLVEFFIIYSRNFILEKGRIYSAYKNEAERGPWLLIMFSINIVQVLLIFSIAYRLLSLHVPGAFNNPLGVLDSFYFSVITFLTVGYGDILPVAPIARGVVLVQNALTFYTVVVVVNGIMAMHFKK